MTKYHAKKTVIDGMMFDSRKEAQRYIYLKALQKQGHISELDRQVKFVLIPAQRDTSGKLVERECAYKADFVYMRDGVKVVEDVKGVRTPEYIIKRKLMLYIHNIAVKEV